MGIWAKLFKKRLDFSPLQRVDLEARFWQGDTVALLDQDPGKVLDLFEARLNRPGIGQSLFGETRCRFEALPHVLKYADQSRANKFVDAYWDVVVKGLGRADLIYQVFENTYSKYWIKHLQRMQLRPPSKVLDAFEQALLRWDTFTYGDSNFMPSEPKTIAQQLADAQVTLEELKRLHLAVPTSS